MKTKRSTRLTIEQITIALQLQNNMIESLVDLLRGYLGLAASNALFDDTEFMRKYLRGEKVKKRKVRRADD